MARINKSINQIHQKSDAHLSIEKTRKCKRSRQLPAIGSIQPLSIIRLAWLWSKKVCEREEKRAGTTKQFRCRGRTDTHTSTDERVHTRNSHLAEQSNAAAQKDLDTIHLHTNKVWTKSKINVRIKWTLFAQLYGFFLLLLSSLFLVFVFFIVRVAESWKRFHLIFNA